MTRLSRRIGSARVAVFSVAVVVTLLFVTAASASPATPVGPLGVGESAIGPSWDDGGAWEVGAEAAGGSLQAYACSEATYLRNRFTSRGWVSRFLWCGNNAWEQDFKRSSAGGTEYANLDTVDLAFYVGHGSTGSFTFDSSVDDHWLTPSDCNYSWGDGDNEWVGLTSCQVLSDPNRANWAACMKGTHQILGFITNAEAHTGTGTQGYQWAYYITNNWTVTGAWFKACDVSQGSGRAVRALAEEYACYSDRPWSGIVCSDAWDYDYWWWDHSCGSELPGPMDVAQVTQMPVFQTPPLSLAEAEAEFDHLGTVFELPTGSVPRPAGVDTDPELWRVEQNGLELEMEKNSGLFTYYDMDLWTGDTVAAALAPTAARISPATAKDIADQFLNSNGLMPTDASYYETVADVVTSGDNTPGAASIGPSVDTVYQVIYSRTVSGEVVKKTGASEVMDFLVVGPGAKLKVYVPTDGVGRSAGENQALPVSGVQGGWRDVGTTPAAVVDTVPIINEAQVLKAYEQVPQFVLINEPPIDADSSNVISTTLAYWEDGVSSIQSELLPVYALYVEYFQGASSLNKDFAYIPANETYMRPYAEILSGPTAPVRVGQEVQLTAADATKTLQELGYDPLLNFTLGNGTYLYEWFVDTISDATRIGGGASPNLTYKVRPSPDAKGSTYKQTVILRVTDIGSSDLRTSVANYSLEIFPRVMMPITTRNN